MNKIKKIGREVRRYNPTATFVETINRLVDKANGIDINVQKLKKNRFPNNKITQLLVDTINNMVDGKAARLNPRHMRPYQNRQLASKLNEVSETLLEDVHINMPDRIYDTAIIPLVSTQSSEDTRTVKWSTDLDSSVCKIIGQTLIFVDHYEGPITITLKCGKHTESKVIQVVCDEVPSYTYEILPDTNTAEWWEYEPVFTGIVKITATYPHKPQEEYMESYDEYFEIGANFSTEDFTKTIELYDSEIEITQTGISFDINKCWYTTETGLKYTRIYFHSEDGTLEKLDFENVNGFNLFGGFHSVDIFDSEEVGTSEWVGKFGTDYISSNVVKLGSNNRFDIYWGEGFCEIETGYEYPNGSYTFNYLALGDVKIPFGYYGTSIGDEFRDSSGDTLGYVIRNNNYTVEALFKSAIKDRSFTDEADSASMSTSQYREFYLLVPKYNCHAEENRFSDELCNYISDNFDNINASLPEGCMKLQDVPYTLDKDNSAGVATPYRLFQPSKGITQMSTLLSTKRVERGVFKYYDITSFESHEQ